MLIQGKKEELPPYLNEVRGAVLKLITDQQTKKVDPEIYLPGQGMLSSCCGPVVRWFQGFSHVLDGGLCNHKGLEPLYPIYQHALVNGNPEAREVAAKGAAKRSLDSRILPNLSSVVSGRDVLENLGDALRVPQSLATNRGIVRYNIVIQVLEAVHQVLVSWWITPRRRHWLPTQ